MSVYVPLTFDLCNHLHYGPLCHIYIVPVTILLLFHSHWLLVLYQLHFWYLFRSYFLSEFVPLIKLAFVPLSLALAFMPFTSQTLVGLICYQAVTVNVHSLQLSIYLYALNSTSITCSESHEIYMMV